MQYAIKPSRPNLFTGLLSVEESVSESLIFSLDQAIYKQDAQLSQRDRAAGYISFGRKWKTGTQRQYFTDIVSLASTTVT